MIIKLKDTEYVLDTTFRTYDLIEAKTNKSLVALLSGFKSVKRADMINILTYGVSGHSEKNELLGVLQQTAPLVVAEHYANFLKALLQSGMSEEEIAEMDRKNEEALRKNDTDINTLMGE